MHFCNFTLIEKVKKPSPLRHITPSHWIQSRGHAPCSTNLHHLLKNQKQSAGSSDSPSLSLSLWFSSTSLAPPSPPLLHQSSQ